MTTQYFSSITGHKASGIALVWDFGGETITTGWLDGCFDQGGLTSAACADRLLLDRVFQVMLAAVDYKMWTPAAHPWPCETLTWVAGPGHSEQRFT
jgi:hypothetical protein